MMTKRDIGDFGEKVCVKFLRKSGYKIVGRNVRMGHLEIDIIASDKTHIVFVEVKTRNTEKNNILRPAAAVDSDKRTNLINFAYSFVKSLPEKEKNKQPRIDVCEVLVSGDKKLKVCDFNYIENAVTR